MTVWQRPLPSLLCLDHHTRRLPSCLNRLWCWSATTLLLADPSSGDVYWTLDVPSMPRLQALTWSFEVEADDETAAAAKAFRDADDSARRR